jgi:hypothetical protein
VAQRCHRLQISSPIELEAHNNLSLDFIGYENGINGSIKPELWNFCDVFMMVTLDAL